MVPELGVVAIVKDEAARLPEWLAFHELVGVGRFFVYDNGSEDDTARILDAHPSVQRVWMPGPLMQLTAYTHALREFRSSARWLAFIDADEFLFSPTFLPLPRVLDENFSRELAVGVCWAMYGTSGLESPPSLQVESLTRRARVSNPVNRHVKSIVNPRLTRGVAADPHHFKLAGDRRTVDDRHRPFTGPFAPEPTWKLLRINHYWSRSIPEAEAKAKVRRADNGQVRPIEHLCHPDFNEVEDPVLAAYAPLVRERMQLQSGDKDAIHATRAEPGPDGQGARTGRTDPAARETGERGRGPTASRRSCPTRSGLAACRSSCPSTSPSPTSSSAS